MTTMAAMLGALPLVIATGPGSELRRPLGITIIGGLLVSQALTLYTTPVIYLLLDRLHRRLGGRSFTFIRRGGPASSRRSERGREFASGRMAPLTSRVMRAFRPPKRHTRHVSAPAA